MHLCRLVCAIFSLIFLLSIYILLTEVSLLIFDSVCLLQRYSHIYVMTILLFLPIFWVVCVFCVLNELIYLAAFLLYSDLVFFCPSEKNCPTVVANLPTKNFA